MSKDGVPKEKVNKVLVDGKVTLQTQADNTNFEMRLVGEGWKER